MSFLVLKLIIDCGRAPHVSVEIGVGWAKATVYYPNLPTDVSALKHWIKTAASMLSASGIKPSRGFMVRIEGDSILVSEAELVRRGIEALWADAGFACPILAERGDPDRAQPESGVEAMLMQESKKASGTASLLLPNSNPNEHPTWSNVIQNLVSDALPAAAVNGASDIYSDRRTIPARLVAPQLGVPKASPDSLHVGVNQSIVDELVGVVRQYVHVYGSAPDFGTAKLSVQEKVHNYIRSVTARPNLSPEVLEAVRKKLAEPEN